MRLLMIMMATVIGGMAAHSIRRVIEMHFSSSEIYQRLAAYATGYLLLQPFAILIGIRMKDVGDEQDNQLLSNVTAGALFGGGVLIGYVLDIMSDEAIK